MHQLLQIISFAKHFICWCLLLLLIQIVFVAPLDKGQKYIQVMFAKPITSMIMALMDLPQKPPAVTAVIKPPAVTAVIKPPAVTAVIKPPAVWLKKEEHLFHPIIIEVANRHEIDPALVKAIIMAESGYNPKAISKRGAKGLMQLMPKTAESLGVEDVFDPEHNINGGVKYFKQLVNLFNGDIKLALAAYNAGIRKVKKFQGIPPFKATRYFIKKVFKYYEYYQEQMNSDLNRT
ncbi:lytic transglycosylase domain-containing protein [Thermodesulfobacteriota bacterium]